MKNIHNALRYLWVIALVASLLASAGCKKKKPQVPPPQAQAPTVTPAAQPPAQPPTEPQPSTSTEPATGTTTTATPTEKPPETTTPAKPAPSTTGRRNHRTTAKNKPAAPKTNPPASAQAQQPATKPPSQSGTSTDSNSQTAAKATTPAAPPPSPPPSNSQIAPGMSPVDEYQNKQTTAQLIERCEAGLKGINRNLSDEEKVTLSNIRNFITQARAELANGDVELAHNYASKAYQLCEELVKH
jgi:hypothetical protein